jgi:hypothetical protein
MAKKKQNIKSETDSAYFLKIVLYIMLGMFWLRFETPLHIGTTVLVAFPVGLIVALLFIRHDHFAIDRKIEYPIVIIATIVSFFVGSGIIL